MSVVHAEIEFQPAGQVFDLVVDGGAKIGSEGLVLVDGVDAENAGLVVGGGVYFADESVAVQDR